MTEKDEILSAAVFNPNKVNLAIGTSHGNVYLASIREDVSKGGRPRFLVGKLDNIQSNNSAVTSLNFSLFDPFGSFLVSFDNGTIKTW